MELQLDGLAKEAVLDEDKVNNGVWVHLDSATPDPDTGLPTPLYLRGDPSKPQRALVRSYRCRAIKEAEAERQKSGFTKIRLAKKKDRDGVIAESSILPEETRFSYFLVALDNFSKVGGVQSVSQQDAEAIHGMTSMDNIVQQVREAAYDDALFAASEATPEGNASTSPPKPTATTAEDPA